MPVAEAQQIFSIFLREDETILRAFTHTRDKVVFTDKKLICLDAQGLTGKKKEYRFFPYGRISSFSIETSGTLDYDSDFKIWVSGVGAFTIKFGRSIDIKAIGRFLAKTIE